MQRGTSALRRALALHGGAAAKQDALAVAAVAAGPGAGPSSVRAFSSPPPGPSVAPAITSVDIANEWYNRQRQSIPLGNRVPDTAVGVYISPSATIVGDVDVEERVRAARGRAEGAEGAWGRGGGGVAGGRVALLLQRARARGGPERPRPAAASRGSLSRRPLCALLAMQR
jgi:hypothetical protein